MLVGTPKNGSSQCHLIKAVGGLFVESISPNLTVVEDELSAFRRLSDSNTFKLSAGSLTGSQNTKGKGRFVNHY